MRYTRRVIIYAIFFCMQAAQSCQPAGPLHPGPDGTLTSFYGSLAACEKVVASMAGGAPLDHGRFYMDTDKTMWYQCLSRHVDTWQQP